MIISENKLKGMIAFSLMLAVIPFFCLIFHSALQYRIPAFADQCVDCLAVEIAGKNQNAAGIYFVPPGTTVGQLVESAAIKKKPENDFQLQDGMRLIMDSDSVDRIILTAAMPSTTRLSLGLPIDINKASEEDLLLIRGIGQATAQNILALRDKLKRFDDMSQLMEIKGIKEKRLAEIKKYLYAGERQK